jgi:hypothetical protein
LYWGVALVLAALPLYRGVALVLAAMPLYWGVALVMPPIQGHGENNQLKL